MVGIVIVSSTTTNGNEDRDLIERCATQTHHITLIHWTSRVWLRTRPLVTIGFGAAVLLLLFQSGPAGESHRLEYAAARFRKSHRQNASREDTETKDSPYCRTKFGRLHSYYNWNWGVALANGSLSLFRWKGTCQHGGRLRGASPHISDLWVWHSTAVL